MDLDLGGRVALVTGATRGIGREIARAFSAEGARVAVTYHTDAEAADKLVAELGADQALAVQYSLDARSGHERAIAGITERWGRLDVLVANAVRRLPRPAAGDRFENADTERWLPVIEDNLAGTINTVRCAVAVMRRRKHGRIALISSHNALGGGRGQEFYAAGKAGLHGFARSLAWDVGRDGILVNVVCPGLTTTAQVLAKLPPAVREGERDATPTGRLSTPEEVARAVVFLCSGANGNISGEALSVSGGR